MAPKRWPAAQEVEWQVSRVHLPHPLGRRDLVRRQRAVERDQKHLHQLRQHGHRLLQLSSGLLAVGLCHAQEGQTPKRAAALQRAARAKVSSQSCQRALQARLSLG